MPLDYYGINDLYRSVEEIERRHDLFKGQLITNGMYGMVRHPMYLLLLMSFLITPVMSLDRFCLMLAVGLYLTFAIPFEEKHLIKEFGTRY